MPATTTTTTTTTMVCSNLIHYTIFSPYSISYCCEAAKLAIRPLCYESGTGRASASKAPLARRSLLCVLTGYHLFTYVYYGELIKLLNLQEGHKLKVLILRMAAI